MNVLHIETPFYGAWSIYNWERNIPGVGVDMRKIDQALAAGENIYLKVGKDETIYSIAPQTVLNIARHYNSIRTVRRGIKVAVIPLNELEVLNVELNR